MIFRFHFSVGPQELLMKFDYAATTPLVTETLGSDFVGMESSGAEFLPTLHNLE